MDKSMIEMGAALDEISWVWLSDNHPRLAEAVEEAVEKQAQPEAVRRFVMERTGRQEIAARCEQAARWLGQRAG